MNTSLLYIVGLLVRLLPETKCFKLKRRLYCLSGAKIGRNTKICSSVRIIGSGNLTIGDHVWIGPNCLISTSADVTIGSDVNIAPCVSIICGSHAIDYDGVSIAGEGISDIIVIKDGCWICASSTILGSSIIGKKSIVGAGAITKGEYPDNQLLVGVIAKMKPLIKNQ